MHCASIIDKDSEHYTECDGCLSKPDRLLVISLGPYSGRTLCEDCIEHAQIMFTGGLSYRKEMLAATDVFFEVIEWLDGINADLEDLTDEELGDFMRAQIPTMLRNLVK